MSLDNIENFDKFLKKNTQLNEQLGKLLAGITDEQEKFKRIVKFAKKQGFDFTESELHNFWYPDDNGSVNQDDDLANNNSQEAEQAEVELKLNPRVPGIFTRIFIWLSGSSSEVLATCPHSEQIKHTALGMTVLIPVLFAIITSSFILNKLNSDIYVKLLIPIMWALIILIMDRSLLATYRAYLPLIRRVSQFIFRLLIALLIGIAIAHPLNLMLFHVEISREIEAKKIEDVAKIEKERKKLDDEKFGGKNFTVRLAEGTQRIQAIHSRQPSVCQMNPVNILSQSGTNDRLIGYQRKEKDLKNELDKQRRNLQEWGRLIEAEKSGTKYSTEINETHYETSGKRKCGEQCKSYKSSKEQEESQIQSTEKELKNLSNLVGRETARSQSDIEARTILQKEQEIENKQRCAEAQKKDEVQRVRDLQIAQDEQENIVREQKEHQKKIVEINVRGSDILTQTAALHSLIKSSEAWFYLVLNYFGWALLFFLIDTLPIILKFSSAGTYDKLVQAREAVYDEDYRKKYTEFEKSVQLEKERLNSESEKFRSRDETLKDFLNRMKQLDADFLADESRERSIITHIKDPFSKKLKEEVLAEKLKLHHQYKLAIMQEFFANISII